MHCSHSLNKRTLSFAGTVYSTEMWKKYNLRNFWRDWLVYTRLRNWLFKMYQLFATCFTDSSTFNLFSGSVWTFLTAQIHWVSKYSKYTINAEVCTTPSSLLSIMGFRISFPLTHSDWSNSFDYSSVTVARRQPKNVTTVKTSFQLTGGWSRCGSRIWSRGGGTSFWGWKLPT